MSDQLVQGVQNLGRISRQHPVGVRHKHLQCIVILPSADQSISVSCNSTNLVVNSSQLVGNTAGFSQTPRLQISLQQNVESVSLIVEVCHLLQTLDRSSKIPSIKRQPSTEQQSVAVVRIQRQHALQNFFRRGKSSASPQALHGGGENVPGLGFLPQPYVNLSQPGPHVDVVRIHFQSLLENANSLLQFPAA